MNESGPTQTPATTTREKSGAESTISAITPGTPTHSKIDGTLRADAGLLRQAPGVPPAERQALEFLARVEGELESVGRLDSQPGSFRGS